MNPQQLEQYSSAITLSDMEVFVFPQLQYSLVLANIMSPILWKWREEECFKKLQGKSPYKKLMRLKQFIMDEYEFNLDLNTWGITNQEVELKRFENFISPQDIARSNALFGYTGDKYYFDVDIRRHFGLDKYDGDVIPYWKTETVEAMNAFRFKDGYSVGAGECVSLSTLYAAAAFIVCGIPLEDIYMVLTPLHSQNFIDIQDGVLTNNRRIVTKTMWFNGTAISNKAQRALRNEQVTIVAHSTGYNHCFYKDATIDKEVYDKFTEKLYSFLSEELSSLSSANFLRSNPKYQKYFQFCRQRRGNSMFVKAETVFHYEHGSSNRSANGSFTKLLDEVSSEDFTIYKIADRLCVEQLMAFVDYENIDINDEASRKKLADYLKPFAPDAQELTEHLLSFLHLRAKLPDKDKTFSTSDPIHLSTEQSREQIIEYLQSIRRTNITADLAFYTYRDMQRCDWQPFIKAAIERNPVSIEALRDRSIGEAYQWLEQMANNSIYDGQRLSQPDEVVNFHTGDGVEKAILLANVIKNRHPEMQIEMIMKNNEVILKTDTQFRFKSNKNFNKTINM